MAATPPYISLMWKDV